MGLLNLLTAELDRANIPYDSTPYTLTIQPSSPDGFKIALEVDPVGPDYIITYGEGYWRAHFWNDAESAAALILRGLRGDVRVRVAYMRVMWRGNRFASCVVEREADGEWRIIGRRRAIIAPIWIPAREAIYRNSCDIPLTLDLAELKGPPGVLPGDHENAPAVRRRVARSALLLAGIGVLLMIGGWLSGPMGHWLQWAKAGIGGLVAAVSLIRWRAARRESPPQQAA